MVGVTRTAAPSGVASRGVPPTLFRRGSTFATRHLGARAIVWLALAGQLALLADGAIAHVTCAVHGDLVHATAPASPATAPSGSAQGALLAGVASDEGFHDRCLVDEDGDVACRPSTMAVPAPARVGVASVAFGPRDRNPRRGVPLYRLAPKSSPPA